MRITKRQLRRIIREEKAKVLAEQKVRRIVRRQLLEVTHLPGDVIEYDDGHEAVAAMNMKTSGFSTDEGYDQGIALFATLYGDKEAAEKVYEDLRRIAPLRLTGAKPGTSKAWREQYPGYSPEVRKAREDVMASYKSGNRDWKDMLKRIPGEIKENLFTYEPSRDVRKKFGLGEFAKEV